MLSLISKPFLAESANREAELLKFLNSIKTAGDFEDGRCLGRLCYLRSYEANINFNLFSTQPKLSTQRHGRVKKSDYPIQRVLLNKL